MKTTNAGDPFAALRDTVQVIGRKATYALAPALHNILGVPVIPDPLVPEGQALMMGNPGTASRQIIIGIPSRNATEAALIVREGLADVLAWLGKPVEPIHLGLAKRYYGLDR